MYDYMVVGSGLYGAVFAHEMHKKGKSVLVVEKRAHIGGNIYTKNIEGINVHMYGPHCFHTNNLKIWNYIQKFAEFKPFIYRPKVNYENQIFSFPINMMTFYQLWGTITPDEVKEKLKEVRIPCENPQNAEDYLLAAVGEEIYQKFFYGYSKKHWNREPRELPVFIVKKLPIRLTYEENHYLDQYQGIPIGGYTRIIENLLDGIEVDLNTDFFDIKDWRKYAKKLVYTGPIDRFFDYKFGELEYRSLKFETKVLDTNNYQGCHTINYTHQDIPYTRVVEHKFFEGADSDKTVVTWEHPQNWSRGVEPYYPINDKKNNKKYQEYRSDGFRLKDVIFGGRQGTFKYIDMDATIASSLKNVQRELGLTLKDYW